MEVTVEMQFRLQACSTVIKGHAPALMIGRGVLSWRLGRMRRRFRVARVYCAGQEMSLKCRYTRSPTMNALYKSGFILKLAFNGLLDTVEPVLGSFRLII